MNFDRFSASKWVKIQISNSITFCVVKIKGSLTERFFGHSKLYFMLNFSDDRMSRKKMRNKTLLVLIFECQK